MTHSLPVGGWVEIPIDQEKGIRLITDYKSDDLIGFGFEVDIHNPDQLHNQLDFAPFAHLNFVDPTQLSKTQQESLKLLNPTQGPRLVPTLADQLGTFRHVKYLQSWLLRGVEIKIKRAIQFRQEPVFRDWIEVLHKKRMSCTSKVMKNAIKYIMNSSYGKLIEDKSTRKNNNLYDDVDKMVYAAGKAGTNFDIISEDPFLALVEKTHGIAQSSSIRRAAWAGRF
jgi:hypothetical protein